MPKKTFNKQDFTQIFSLFDISEDEKLQKKIERIKSLTYDELLAELRKEGKDVDSTLRNYETLMAKLLHKEPTDNILAIDSIKSGNENIISLNKKLESKTVIYNEVILPLAASDDSLQETGIEYDLKGIDGSISSEVILGDPIKYILQFKCVKECIDKFEGGEVVVEIGNNCFNLGKISRRGIAEVEVPVNIDMLQKIRLLIQKDSGEIEDG